ncbi:MAG: uncharacterized protein KVP18_002392 [Porospora cf. gigantea A]|uniref:uncharacterized protein n=1 Tax=Porospora cf. gigantea A TaxID=2853593 RepID=UPI003559D2E2|nr:MAG: hypothetical protein KVP18_002392 [Porospora cf. gigantea A]
MTDAFRSLLKEQVPERFEAAVVDKVEFGILSAEEMARMADVRVRDKGATNQILNREFYIPMTGVPVPNGLLDTRLGARRGETCPTCKQGVEECSGHWGFLGLSHPVFHTGYFKHLVNILYCVCKSCSKLLLDEEQKTRFLRLNRSLGNDRIRKRVVYKQVVDKCKKAGHCYHGRRLTQCGAPQGTIKRVQKPQLENFMKLFHTPKVKDASGRTTIRTDDLDPVYVTGLLKRIEPADCELLGITQPHKLLVHALPVPPSCVRPTVMLPTSGTNEDDLTCILGEIADLNIIMGQQIGAGAQPHQFLGNWEFLQLQCSRYINSDAPGIAQLLQQKGNKVGRGICQRLKGKEGRFRGNLSGKRVDFSGRTVISPDPNCPVDCLIVPEFQAKRLTFPEIVSPHNISTLRLAVLRGVDDWPGASNVFKKDGTKSSLKFANRRHLADGLQVGDTVERHLKDGDVVLFNRQPSLHRMSIMAHKAIVRPWRTLRFNECVCNPYNADFDGDEMNCHVPQTQEARAEALLLMGVTNNLVTPKNGEPLVAATQDFLSGTYMLTHKDVFFTRDNFCQTIAHFTDGLMHIDLPPPTIIKPVELWTGKQVFNVVLRPNQQSHVILNFGLKEREFRDPTDEPPFMCLRDGYILFRDSELVSGTIGKKTIGGGSKEGLFYHLIRDNTAKAAALIMGRIAQLAARWFHNRGMTIGIDDVTPSPAIRKEKKRIIEEGLEKVAKVVTSYHNKTLAPHPGCTLEQTREAQEKGILDDLRMACGNMCNRLLHPLNKPVIMLMSGAKGAVINIAQMVALVGQQNVGGQRIRQHFVNRTLPHFVQGSVSPRSMGFVANSFFTGLDPDEFFFHTMSGREGLVDTAVKTADTGYMQRRLMKCLEDLCLRYDRTVRMSDGQIVQFVYGDDGLNPVMLENLKDGPLVPMKVLSHVRSFTRAGWHPDRPLALEPCWMPDPRHRNHHAVCVLPPEAGDVDLIRTRVEELIHKFDSRDLGQPSQSQAGHFSRDVKQKLLCLKAMDRMRDLSMLDSKCSEVQMALQVRCSIEAHVAVHEWLPSGKRNLPLLPFEIREWCEFLIQRCAEVLPSQIVQHQDLARSEPPTHQAQTKHLRVFMNDLRDFVDGLVQSAGTERESLGELPAVSPEQYEEAIRSMAVLAALDSSSELEMTQKATQLRFQLLKNEQMVMSQVYGAKINDGRLVPADANCDYPPFMESLRQVGVEPQLVDFQVKTSLKDMFVATANGESYITPRQLLRFLSLAWKKYSRAVMEPGEAAGAIGAQSIGEPGTQMTLKTFHFAGVASMNVTLGVPRIKEIINASSNIDTPIVDCCLTKTDDYEFALSVKGSLESTKLSSVCEHLKEVYSPNGCWLTIKLCARSIHDRRLQLDAKAVRASILAHGAISKIHLKEQHVEAVDDYKLIVRPPDMNSLFFQMQQLRMGIGEVSVAGIPSVKRGVVKHNETRHGTEYSIAVEGTGLSRIMSAHGVRGELTRSNNVMEVKDVLGVEASRRVIIEEIKKCMDAYNMDIDCRHMQLLGDVMTFR